MHRGMLNFVGLGLFALLATSVTGCNQEFVIKKESPVLAPNVSLVPVDPGTPVTHESGSLTANDDGPYEIAQNQSLTIPIADLLANDRDSRNLPIAFVSFQNLSSGNLSQSGASLVFQPARDFLGAVTFTYSIRNSENRNASAKVSIFVRRPAAEMMYGHTYTQLYSYDAATRSETFIANFRLSTGGTPNISDIAITSNGLMYGVDGSSLSNIDASSGLVSRISTTGIEAFGNINGLTALSDGRIVISGNGVAVYNVVNHTLSTLLAPGTYQSSGDIIALPDNYLYMVALGSGSDRLIRIDPNSGASVVIGSLGHSGVYGLGYASNVLYGFAGNGDVFQINPANAAISSNSTSSLFWTGATTNPVLW